MLKTIKLYLELARHLFPPLWLYAAQFLNNPAWFYFFVYIISILLLLLFLPLLVLSFSSVEAEARLHSRFSSLAFAFTSGSLPVCKLHKYPVYKIKPLPVFWAINSCSKSSLSLLFWKKKAFSFSPSRLLSLSFSYVIVFFSLFFF